MSLETYSPSPVRVTRARMRASEGVHHIVTIIFGRSIESTPYRNYTGFFWVSVLPDFALSLPRGAWQADVYLKDVCIQNLAHQEPKDGSEISFGFQCVQ